MDVAILGGGFVGTATAAALTAQGHRVDLIEVDARRRERLAEGRLPFHEEGLEQAITAALQRGALRVLPALDAARPVEVVLLCVGTPPRPDGSAALDQIEDAAAAVGRHMARTRRPLVVAVKSTVPPGTTRTVVGPVVAQTSGGIPFGLAMTPEFLCEGTALQDALRPSRVVIGADTSATEETLRRLFRPFHAPTIVTDPDAAEMIKYVSNGYLASRVAFANEAGNLAEALGLDVDEVMAAVGLDPRIGPRFLEAGLGFGGSCFPKDLAALRALASRVGVRTPLLDSILAQNDTQPLRAVELLEHRLGDLSGLRIALLGLAFKPGTSDVRESRAGVLHRALVERGVDVVCHDPVAGEDFRAAIPGAKIRRTAEDALRGVDAAIVQTAWPHYRSLSPALFLDNMRRPLLVDGRRILDTAALRAAGVEVLCIGNGKGRTHESRHSRSGPWNTVPPRNEIRA